MGKELWEIEEANSSALFPEIASHLWEYFSELNRFRTYGLNGPNPISSSDIFYWSNLTGIQLSTWEVSVIKSLDDLWIKINMESADG